MNQTDEKLMKELLLASRFIMRPHGRPMGQENILRKLKKGPMNQKDLQEEMGVRPGSISELISKLEEKEYIVRNKDENDARAVQVSLTDCGEERLSQMEKQEDLFTSLSEEEKIQLTQILTKLNNDWIRRGPLDPPPHHKHHPEDFPDEFEPHPFHH